MSREDEYNQKRKKLIKRCEVCKKTEHPSTDRCDYHCQIGLKLRWLETEFSDITGWNHNKTWK